MAKWKEITSLHFTHTCSSPDTRCKCELGINHVKLNYKIVGEIQVSVDTSDGTEAANQLGDHGWTITEQSADGEPAGMSKSGEFESIDFELWGWMMCRCGELACSAKTYRITVQYTRGKNTPEPTISGNESAVIPCGDLMIPANNSMPAPSVSDNGSRVVTRFNTDAPCAGTCNAQCTLTFSIDYDYRVASDCFITTVVYGTGLHPEITMLQGLRDNLIRRTRWGSQFFDKYFEAYEKVSPEIAKKIKENPDAKEAILWGIIRPWVNYIKLALRRPSVWNLDSLDPELKNYLQQMKQEFDQWLDVIELPKDFNGMTNQAAIEELNVLLLILKEKGDAYLDELVSKKILPLQVAPDEYREFALKLKTADCFPKQIEKIIKIKSQ